jgi:hypothetical protein
LAARLVDRIVLQDDALLDRGDRSAFRRDRGLVLRDGRLVIARVDREKRLAGLDCVAGYNVDASDDPAALDGESGHLTRRLDDAGARHVIVLGVCGDCDRRHRD